MLFSLFSLLVGRVTFTTNLPVLVANLLREGVFSAFGFHVQGDRAVFSCLWWQKKRVAILLEEHGISCDGARYEGLFGFFHRYRARVGALAGVLAALAITVLSEEFIWQIEVTGNERMSDEDVLAVLEEQGVFEGAYIGSIDPLSVANRCVIASDEISWMSVNIVGNCVEAVVMEYHEKELEEKRSEVYTKLPESLKDFLPEAKLTKGEFDVDDLLNAYMQYLNRLKLSKPLNTRITKKELSVDDKIKEIRVQTAIKI